MKRIGKTGVQVALVLVLALSLALGTAVPVAKASLDNEVDLNFFTYYLHYTDLDSVGNGSLPATNKVTVAGIHNTDDSTNADVLAPVLTFDRDPLVTVESVDTQGLVSEDPWVWNLPTILEGEGQQRSANVAADSSSFEPGFSVTRTLTPTEFTGPGTHTQTLEINTTPAVSMDELYIVVMLPGDDLLTATITSATGDGDINWSANNVEIKIADPDETTPATYTQNITIEVVLNEGVASASFKPMMYVVAWHDTPSATETGTTVTRPMELGTWTWQTGDSYSWHWSQRLGKAVVFPQIERNRVGVNFETHYNYWTEDDSVPNITTTQPASISSDLHNRGDGTGQPVVGPSSEGGPILNLSTTETVTDFQRDYWRDPSAYIWDFPAIEEHQGFNRGAGIEQTAEFSPGFSVSRSVSPGTTFPSTGGTQVLTLSVTPEEAMDRLEIHGKVDMGGPVSATIDSVTGDYIDYDNQSFYIGIDDVVVEDPPQTYQWQITINIAPLPPEYPAVDVEYMLFIEVRNLDIIASGGFYGSSLSGSSLDLDETTVLGTWEWQATGDYSWSWQERVSRAVHLEGYAEIQVNRVGVNFETSHSYRTEDNFVPNITTELFTGIHSGLRNRGADNGQAVLNPILELSTTETVTDVNPEEYLVSTDPYIWEFPDIEQDQGQDGDVNLDLMVELSTGFSAERSVNKTSFLPSGGTQILTVSVTPEEPMDGFEVWIGADVGKLDIATITSPTSGDGIHLHDDGRRLSIHIEEPQIDQLYQWVITIDIGSFPPEYQGLEYMPWVDVQNVEHIDSGSLFGNSLSQETAMATWTWQATGDYLWEWDEEVYKSVHLEGQAAFQVNVVGVNSETSYTYRTACDSVGNITTELPADIGSWMHNEHDGTGQIVDNPSVELDTTETVTDVWPEEYLVSTDPYIWEFPDMEESNKFDAGARLAQTLVFSPGFSVERSIDPVRLPPEGGTQILMLTVTVEEEMEGLGIHGKTDVKGLEGIATVTSASGENIGIHDDGRGFDAWIDEPIVDHTYQWQITIDIAPLPPEFLALGYMPYIQVRNRERIAGGSVFGNSLSQETAMGTWTWQATDECLWEWSEQLVKRVNLEGYAVHAYVDAPTQEAIDQAIDAGQAWLRTQQHGDGSWYWTHNPGEEPEGPSVGMTGLAVWSLIHGLVPPTDPQVQAGIEFILSQQNRNPDDEQNYGGIWSHGPDVYETAIAILALRATANDDYLDEIALAAEYLARCQNDEGVIYYHPEFPGGSTTIDSEHWAYGGWDYGYASVHTDYRLGEEQWEGPPYVRSDLSCTQFAMIGLKVAEEAGVELTHDSWANIWSKAEGFVTRCQNLDGGFTYQPQHDAGGGGGSYGSMSAAGVWSLRLAGVEVLDDRVQDGLAWLNCHDFYDRNPRSGGQNHYYFLWTAAKAFTMCDQEPILEEGTWYYDYAGYLLANQDESGQWLNPNYGVDNDRESYLNRTEYALLVLERAVLPPPPGIDLIHIEIDSMKILFDRSPNRDNVEIKAHLQLAEGASYNLDEDRVKVTIDGAVTVIIPAGSFVGSAGKYEFKLDGEPKIGMKLNFNDGTWSLKIGHTDASAVDNCDGVNVALVIGDMFTGQNVLMWIPLLEYP